MFCGPETVDVSRNLASQGKPGLKTRTAVILFSIASYFRTRTCNAECQDTYTLLILRHIVVNVFCLGEECV